MKVIITRVSLSLPCKIPVLPGTPEADAPLEDRIEYCATDAWWFVGQIPTCDLHLRGVLKLMDDDYDAFMADFLATHPEWDERIPNDSERKPWAERYRYSDDIQREEP